MSRLFIQVEGPTEEEFVNEVLRPHLITHHSYHTVDARIVGNSRLREKRGGIRGWSVVKKEIVERLQYDRGVFITMLVDYYALPKGPPEDDGWPGRGSAAALPFAQKAGSVECSLAVEIAAALPEPRDHRRFIPFIVMHEFEALLFSDPTAMARGFNHADAAPVFTAIANQFASPEEINDSPLTAPSKRIIKVFEDRGYDHYEKPLLGNLAALEVTLPVIRGKCPHFHAWLSKLERLGNANSSAAKNNL
jgi:hypothetical protein